MNDGMTAEAGAYIEGTRRVVELILWEETLQLAVMTESIEVIDHHRIPDVGTRRFRTMYRHGTKRKRH